MSQTSAASLGPLTAEAVESSGEGSSAGSIARPLCPGDIQFLRDLLDGPGVCRCGCQMHTDFRSFRRVQEQWEKSLKRKVHPAGGPWSPNAEPGEAKPTQKSGQQGSEMLPLPGVTRARPTEVHAHPHTHT